MALKSGLGYQAVVRKSRSRKRFVFQINGHEFGLNVHLMRSRHYQNVRCRWQIQPESFLSIIARWVGF